MDCICEFGTVRVTNGRYLQDGQSKSCGCFKDEELIKRNTTHGMSKNRLYAVWNTMIQRCTNPNFEQYHDYGGRGIVVCNRWKDSFENFYRDMGESPTPKYTLDRIDNSKDYEPGNVRWATHIEQGRNKRSNRNLTMNDVTKSISSWAREYKIHVTTLRHRIDKLGMSLSQALTTPKMQSIRSKDIY